MIINNVRIFLSEKAAGGMKAAATVLVNNQILLQDIRILTAKDDETKLRVSYPIQWMGNRNLRHCLYPSNEESRRKYDAAILEAYQKVVSGEISDKTVVFSEDGSRPGYEATRAGIYPLGGLDSHRAKVGIELDGELWLRGMFLTVRSSGEFFLNMPSRKTAEYGKPLAFFHPVDQAARNVLTEAVMPFYEETVQNPLRAATPQ